MTFFSSSLDPCERATRHAIVCERPAVGFFEGALLGNGGLGAVVTTRPDAVVIRFGHNNVWDIRVAEKHADKIGTFTEIFERVKSISKDCKALKDDPWFAEYCATMRENYAQPYPRPFPCGSLLLGFDRRDEELLGHRLDIATGCCEVRFLVKGKPARLQVFTDMMADRLWLRWLDDAGAPSPSLFNRVRLIPDPATPADMPPWTEQEVPDGLAFYQILPFQVPDEYDVVSGHAQDRALRLAVRLSAKLEIRSHINWRGTEEEMRPLERALSVQKEFVACVQLDEGLASGLGNSVDLPEPTGSNFEAAAARSRDIWREYWGRSAVALDDTELEATWYRNLYFFHCAVREGVLCPGLFANWSYGKIGTAWHGDYHMNYNTQQPFWLTFSSNHVDKHLPYVDLVHHLLPVSRRWAREYYELDGAYFPHSAYPSQMNMMPYPVPDWGWEICETPWTVQSLWWHYLYTQDEEFLRERAWEPLQEAVRFLVAYMMRPEAHGRQWNDDFYHIFPTVPPELYGLRPGFDKNYDCLVDLTLTKFIFQAYLQACRVLKREAGPLNADVRTILQHFPPYPTATSNRGEVWVSVPGENAEMVYNVPNSLAPVFPGEEHGLDSSPEVLEIAVNSYHNHRNEGGNELVFLNLQAARIGQLDLERFKRQIHYCTLPNGTCANMVLQVQGRYKDEKDYAFMAPMGIWFENFALPAVINECLLQSYNGTLRFFPNWPLDVQAEFRTLRAVGAFLVSAQCAQGQVQWIEIISEVGAPLRLINPWHGAKCVRIIHERGEGETAVELRREEVIVMETTVGETLRFIPAA